MNIIEISNKFPTDLDAIRHFEKIRWHKGISCPYCKSTKLGKRNQDYRWHCHTCNKTFSVKTETRLHDSRLSLKQWLYAFGLISNAKKGISALQLQRDLGIDYKTAWSIYHRIRDLMSIENDGITLNDIVETDTTQVDVSMRKCQKEQKGTPANIPELDKKIEQYKDRFTFKEGEYKKPCKQGKQKPGLGASEMKITGIVQRDGNVIAEVIKKTSFSELRKLIDNRVNKNRRKTVVLTDEAKGYNKMKRIINHIKIDHSRLYSYRGLNTNTIESFWAIIERQIKGQHHHVDIKYLDKYVAEAVFKFNNRKKDDMFETLVRFSMLPMPSKN